jgi:hypothetical protein
MPPGHQSLYVFPCRNLSFQTNLQRVRFGIMGLERHDGMVVAPVLFICLPQGKENGRPGRKLTQLHVTLVAARVLTGSAWFSSEGGHTDEAVFR